MLTVNRVNSITNKINFKGENNTNITTDNKPSKDEKMKQSTKLMIGATALAAIIVSGIVLRKIHVAKETAKLLKIERERMPRLFNGSPVKKEELNAKLEEIDKLSPDEQKLAYKKLDTAYGTVTYLESIKASGKGIDTITLRRGMKGIPKDVQKEMADENWLRAAELLEEHIQELPNTFRAQNTGKTIEEAITNIFGKDSKVKPHNYDLTKEAEDIVSLRDYSGYYEVIATPKGLLYDGPANTGLCRAIYNFDNFLNNAKTSKIKDGVSIVHGIDKDKKYVTILRIPDDTERGTITQLGLISRDKKPSPAQKDLLSLVQNPEKFDSSLIDTLTIKTASGVTGAKNMDYDLALSIIQSMAK